MVRLSTKLLLATNKVRQKYPQSAYYVDYITGTLLGIINMTILKKAVMNR